MKWIPVSERLPKIGGRYLTILNNGQIHILTWSESYSIFVRIIQRKTDPKAWPRNWSDSYTAVTDVTHWMPLPEPPEDS